MDLPACDLDCADGIECQFVMAVERARLLEIKSDELALAGPKRYRSGFKWPHDGALSAHGF